jgi:hypothetical protein
MSDEGNVSPSGYESPIRISNPPPPPELQNNEAAMADIIKGTLISKNWVISILLKLIKVSRMDLILVGSSKFLVGLHAWL